MPMQTIGDMRQYFLTSRINTSLRSDLGTLVDELSTGQASDIVQHLGPDQTKLSGIDRQLSLMQSIAQSHTETRHMLSSMQMALSGVEAQRDSSGAALLAINSASSNIQIADAGSVSRTGFELAVSALNTRFGGRAVFGGNDQNSSPLVNAEEMLDAISSSVTGLTSAQDISNVIDDWFDVPGGGFETLAYQGSSTGLMSRSTEANHSLEIEVRADDQAFRDVFKSFAKGAIAGDLTQTIDQTVRQELQQKAGVDLLSSASALASVQARIGTAEAAIEESSVRVSSQSTSYSIVRNELVSADPFETATRLEAVQLQLETHYTLTARLSRLSLTEYLR